MSLRPHFICPKCGACFSQMEVECPELVERKKPRPPMEGVIAFLREAWRNDGAEGESVHALCDEVEQLRSERDKARTRVKDLETTLTEAQEKIRRLKKQLDDDFWGPGWD